MLNLTFQLFKDVKPSQREEIFYINRRGYFGQGVVYMHWEAWQIDEVNPKAHTLDYLGGDSPSDAHILVAYVEDDLLDDRVLWVSMATLRLMLGAPDQTATPQTQIVDLREALLAMCEAAPPDNLKLGPITPLHRAHSLAVAALAQSNCFLEHEDL